MGKGRLLAEELANDQFTRIVLGIQVLSAGVTLPSRIIIKPSMVKSLMMLLGPVMLFAVGIGGCLAKAYAVSELLIVI
jgi:hypothetical protein